MVRTGKTEPTAFPRAVDDPIGRALTYLERCQSEKGSWEGDYGGPIFLLPMYVGTCYAVGRMPNRKTRRGIIRYFRNHQNPDGGWGLHVESPSYALTSVTSYVALRFLGVDPDDPTLAAARKQFAAYGGAKGAASWGKFMLAVLNLYDYKGLHPVQPELWLLPEQLPIHPSRLWCHCRMVYLPMSYLYGRRARIPADPLIRAVRTEIYDEPFEDIDWNACRDMLAESDCKVRHSPLLKAVHQVLHAYERMHLSVLRTRALDWVLEHIRREDLNTNYICIGPVNKLYNTLCWHFHDPEGPELQAHLPVLPQYLYHADDGIKMNGYNNSELWDTAFAVQAICATGRTRKHKKMLQSAHRYVEGNQVLEDVPEHDRYYRHRSRGGWPFSDRPHGWPITDCTSEGLKSALLLEKLVNRPIPKERLDDAVDLILSFQNEDGGWATYELTRGSRWLELLNASDVFFDIMIDYSYVECTSACIQSLKAYLDRFPTEATPRIHRAMERGREFILSTQRTDGSWEGSWGICFTYGTWFGLWGLMAAGLGPDHPAIRNGCRFLVSKQLPDGGWGELPESCLARRYVTTESGQAVMTSWALMALVKGGHKDSEAVKRGVEFLKARQRSDGSWPAEHIAGMFNKSCAIHYDNYLKVFPLWTLALCE